VYGRRTLEGPVPSYEDFGSNVEAHLLYAGSQAPGDALAILRRRFDDQSWRAAPSAWLNRLRVTVHQHQLGHDARVAELRGLLVSSLTAQKIGREAHETLRELFSPEYGVTLGEASRLVAWFVEKAGPGDASLAADVLLAIYIHNNQDHRRAVRPLAEWLITNGAAELRSRRRVGKDVLLLRLVEEFNTPAGDAAMLASLLRYIIASEENLSGHHDFVSDPNGVLRGAVEHVLERDEGSAIPGALAAKLGNSFTEQVLDPHPRSATYPRFRQALVQALARGSLPWPMAREVWKAALWSPCPGAGLSFASAEAIEIAVDALAYHACFPDRRSRAPHGGIPLNDRAWACLLASEFARIHELKEGLPDRARTRLHVCVSRTCAVTEGVGDALRLALVDHPGLAATILAEGLSDGNVMAAIRALPEGSPTRHRGSGDHVEVDEVVPLLTKLLGRPWQEPVFGIDMARALRGATRVELADLAYDDKVLVGDGVVRLDRPEVERMLSQLPMNREAKLALAAMYFVHELVHIEQGIGDKNLVSALRSTGGETTLMHVDLGADHAAALGVTVAFPKWNLNWLKDLQGRSLGASPTSRYNTSAGRARKAQRLVGLRLDYLARNTGLISKDVLGSGYAFADFGPAGGKLLILVSGPPQGVVRAADLSPSEAELLSSAADDGLDARLSKIDRVLVEKLTGSTR
jgi:hypothetical protein